MIANEENGRRQRRAETVARWREWRCQQRQRQTILAV
jgi:hypothetical protein